MVTGCFVVRPPSPCQPSMAIASRAYAFSSALFALVTTSDALVTTSDAPVTSCFLVTCLGKYAFPMLAYCVRLGR